MLQEGVARREFKLSTCHRSGEEHKAMEISLSPVGSKEGWLCLIPASVEEKIHVSLKAGDCVQQLQKQSGPSLMDSMQ